MSNLPSGDAYAPATPAPENPRPQNFFARHKVLTIVGGIVVLVIAIGIGSGAGGSKDDPAAGGATSAAESTADTPAAETPAEPEHPGLNTPVTSGKLEFTAVSVEDAGTTAGGEYLNSTAQGTYKKITLRVTNVSDEPQTFIVNYLQLSDAAGRSYDADATATLYAAGDAQTWIAKINPGNSVEGPVLFDVPVDADVTQLLVRDTTFSSGELISLK